MGTHTVSGEKYYLNISETCRIRPIADDMVLAHKDFQDGSGYLKIADAEDGWFLRMDGDTSYGKNAEYERISIHPSEPLEFFNMDGVPGATCLIWEHIPDSNGKPCSNPRVIIPRAMVDGIVPGDEPQEVNVRSFGVRMPPSTKMAPNYGVMGMLQVVPISIAWVWRLIAPRGFKNPSIADTNAGSGLKAEGVGSYWPFSTGMKVTQANLLLHQMLDCPNTLNILLPNQYIGAYQVGFMGEWISREYLARRTGQIRKKHLVPSRCPLFGYSLDEMRLDGQYVRQTFLRPEVLARLRGLRRRRQDHHRLLQGAAAAVHDRRSRPAGPPDHRARDERRPAGGLPRAHAAEPAINPILHFKSCFSLTAQPCGCAVVLSWSPGCALMGYMVE